MDRVADSDHRSPIARARQTKGLTQKQLGLEVARLNGNEEISPRYAQKKAARWESRTTGQRLRPTEPDIEALSRILGIPKSLIVDDFEPARSGTSPDYPTEDIFEILAAEKNPCFMGVCYSGWPREVSDGRMTELVLTALRNQLRLALFFPFQLMSTGPQTVDYRELCGVYTGIGRLTLDFWKNLQHRLDDDKKPHVRFYGPVQKVANALMPPFWSRYACVVQTTADGALTETLYLYLETRDRDEMTKVGTLKDDQKFAAQVQSWKAYFGEVLGHWERKYELPDRDDIGKYWTTRTDIAQLINGPNVEAGEE